MKFSLGYVIIKDNRPITVYQFRVSDFCKIRKDNTTDNLTPEGKGDYKSSK